jgi:hypothetical protein
MSSGMADEHITRLISQHLHEHPDGAVVVEHPLAAPGDLWLSKGRFPYVVVNSDVFLMAIKMTPEAVIADLAKQILRHGAITALATSQDEVARARATDTWLHHVANAALSVLVEAFDGESCLQWTPVP